METDSGRAAGELIVRARGLGRRFRRGDETIVALEAVDLDVQAGESLTVLGRSGSGKTTLLNLLGAILPPSSGELLLDGRALGDIDESARARLRLSRIGFVFQDFCLVPSLSALDNVRLPLHLAGRLTGSTPRAKALLDSVGLSHRMRHFPGELSRGEMQRVAVARALVAEPVLLLADEPTGHLDEASSESVLELILRAGRDSGAAIIIATHDAQIAGRSGRSVRLRYGRVVS